MEEYLVGGLWCYYSHKCDYARFPVEPIVNSYKFGFFGSLGNNKVSLYQNANVGSGSLIDNLYMFDVVSSYNETLHISSQGEILESLDLSNFEVYVECIKEK
ncbi:hypothetical protein CR513_04417, partial [Mucuna pruriens]